MENKFYLEDIETGYSYEVSKEHYDSYMRMWNLCMSQIKHPNPSIIIYGTSREMNTNKFYDLWKRS